MKKPIAFILATSLCFPLCAESVHVSDGGSSSGTNPGEIAVVSFASLTVLYALYKSLKHQKAHQQDHLSREPLPQKIAQNSPKQP